MTKILDRLPILDKRAFPRFDDKHVRVHRDQILVWVSVNLAGVPDFPPEVPKIPALLETGNNFDFSIQHRHLREWANLAEAAHATVAEVLIGMPQQRRPGHHFTRFTLSPAR